MTEIARTTQNAALPIARLFAHWFCIVCVKAAVAALIVVSTHIEHSRCSCELAGIREGVLKKSKG